MVWTVTLLFVDFAAAAALAPASAGRESRGSSSTSPSPPLLSLASNFRVQIWSSISSVILVRTHTILLMEWLL